MLRDEVELYTKLSGNDGEHTPIGRIGSFLDGYDKGKEDATKWIPCSKRLPDGRLNESFLVQDKDGRRAVGTYTCCGWMFAHYMNDPVAWMPLPEPYKAKVVKA